MRVRHLFNLLCLLLMTGCNATKQPESFDLVDMPAPSPTFTVIVQSASPTPTLTVTATATHTPYPSPSSTASFTPSATFSPTSTPTPTETPTPSLTPTYAILRGKVLEQANCRYGPGAPYLYKYGVYPGSNLEIIGRNELGTWVLVQAIGGSNSCWVKATLLDIKGDVMSLAPTSFTLPRSPYYGPPTGVTASRSGNEVTIRWIGITLRPGDDSEQVPYVVEAWVCQNGQFLFIPVGSYTEQVTILDEPGCSQPSHGRLTAAEKHGYTAYVEIPWP